MGKFEMNYFIYLILGTDSCYREELRCSLLSLKKVAPQPDFSVVIYSDNQIDIPSNFPFSVDVKVLDKSIIESWLEKSNFLLALKPCVINDFFKTNDGNVILLDTDTYFIKNPAPLFASVSRGAYILHLEENSFRGRVNLKNYLEQKKFNKPNGELLKISVDYNMWNSGVIGLNHHHKEVLIDILSLIDQIREDRQWHTIEQFCISYFFQLGEIVSAEFYIVHYWFYKPARHVLLYYFNIPTENTKLLIGNDIRNNVIDKHVSFDQLLEAIVKMFVWHDPIHDWHLYSLPKKTVIGKILRKNIRTYFKYFVLRIKAWFGNLFNRTGILEVEKESYNYRK